MTEKKLTIRQGSARKKGGYIDLEKISEARAKDLAEKSENTTENERVNTGSKDCIPDDIYISRVHPDPNNARDFPVIKAVEERMFLSVPENVGSAYIILEKGLLDNKTPKGHPLYEHIENQIREISALSAQIKAGGGIYQPIEVYRTGGTSYQIVYGHRRFYAVVYWLGWEAAWSFKVHRTTPKNLKLRQFVENHSRSDLAFHEKLKSFNSALEEINGQQNQEELSSAELINLLGIGKSTFFRFKKWNSYPFIQRVAMDGMDFIGSNLLESIFSKVEGQHKESDEVPIEDLLKSALAKEFKKAKRKIPEYLQVKTKHSIRNETPSNTSRPGKKAQSYSAPRIKSTAAIKTLLTSDITQLDIEGVNWSEVDWNDCSQVNGCLSATIKHLEGMKA